MPANTTLSVVCIKMGTMQGDEQDSSTSKAEGPGGGAQAGDPAVPGGHDEGDALRRSIGDRGGDRDVEPFGAPSGGQGGDPKGDPGAGGAEGADPYGYGEPVEVPDARGATTVTAAAAAAAATVPAAPAGGSQSRRRFGWALAAFILALLSCLGELTVGALWRYYEDTDSVTPLGVLIGVVAVLLAAVALWARQPKPLAITALVIAGALVATGAVQAGSALWQEARETADAAAARGGADNPVAVGESVVVGEWKVTIDLVNFDGSEWADAVGDGALPVADGETVTVVSGTFEPLTTVSTIGDPLPSMSIESETLGDTFRLSRDKSIVPGVAGATATYTVGVPTRIHWSVVTPEGLTESADDLTLRMRGESRGVEDSHAGVGFETKYVQLGSASVIPDWATNTPGEVPSTSLPPSSSPSQAPRGGEENPWRVGEAFQFQGWTVTVTSVDDSAVDEGVVVSLTAQNDGSSIMFSRDLEPTFYFTPDWSNAGPRSPLLVPAPEPSFPLSEPVPPGGTVTGNIHFQEEAQNGWALMFEAEDGSEKQYVAAP